MTGDHQALQLIDLLFRLTRSIVDDARGHAEDVAELAVGEFVLLRAIAGGETSPGGLARELHMHPAAISRTLTQLARTGLVERRPAPADSRRTELHLTPTGHDAVTAIAARVRPAVQHRLDALPPGTADQLLAHLSLLLTEPDDAP